MGNFQVSAVLGNGAAVLFGVSAASEGEALLAAYRRLAWFPGIASALTVIPVAGLAARGDGS